MLEEKKKEEFSITCNVKPHLKWLLFIHNHQSANWQEITAYPLAIS